VVDDISQRDDVFLGSDQGKESVSDPPAFFGQDIAQQQPEPSKTSADESASTADPPAFFGYQP
jgi:hypothetical protein